VNTIRTEFQIPEHAHSTDEVMKILAILNINAYEIKMPDVNIQGVYKLASLAEHNCVPNALKSTESKYCKYKKKNENVKHQEINVNFAKYNFNDRFTYRWKPSANSSSSNRYC